MQSARPGRAAPVSLGSLLARSSARCAGLVLLSCPRRMRVGAVSYRISTAPTVPNFGGGAPGGGGVGGVNRAGLGTAPTAAPWQGKARLVGCDRKAEAAWVKQKPRLRQQADSGGPPRAGRCLLRPAPRAAAGALGATRGAASVHAVLSRAPGGGVCRVQTPRFPGPQPPGGPPCCTQLSSRSAALTWCCRLSSSGSARGRTVGGWVGGWVGGVGGGGVLNARSVVERGRSAHQPARRPTPRSH
jgi:hypothetical protein